MVFSLKSVSLALGACLVVAPLSAQADVIQAGPGGFSWVAGSPPTDTLSDPRQSSSSADGRALTRAGESAGPDAWRQHVAMLAAKYDISPALLEAVVWQESRWHAAATSPAGAKGLAQLMPGTARQMGVDIHDPRSNLEGGTRYLRMQLDTFGGDVEKALAAYNAGPGRVERAGGVPKIPETQAYVAAIMSRLSDRIRR